MERPALRTEAAMALLLVAAMALLLVAALAGRAASGRLCILLTTAAAAVVVVQEPVGEGTEPEKT
jgi:hypothetical protein